MLSAETLLEILRHFTRKQLSQTFYLVNRQFHQLATSPHHVPAIHNIQEISFSSPHQTRKRKRLLQSVPGPFIRFNKVLINQHQPDIVLNFMEDAKESFINCKLHIPPQTDVTGDPAQMQFLLQNVFHSPAWIKISEKSWVADPKLILQTKGMTKCKRLELDWNYSYECIEETQKALLNWLQMDSGLRHLILVHFPRQIILGLVRQIKEDFVKNVTMTLNFVVSFEENLEGEDIEFALSDNSTGQRLSLFKHYKVVGQMSNRYRLWKRRVDNETSDATILSCLQYKIEPGSITEFDSEFYSLY